MNAWYLFRAGGGPVQWKLCHFPKTIGVKAAARGKTPFWGWATLFRGIFFGIMYPLFSQFWEALYNSTNVIIEACYWNKGRGHPWIKVTDSGDLGFAISPCSGFWFIM